MRPSYTRFFDSLVHAIALINSLMTVLQSRNVLLTNSNFNPGQATDLTCTLLNFKFHPCLQRPHLKAQKRRAQAGRERTLAKPRAACR